MCGLGSCGLRGADAMTLTLIVAVGGVVILRLVQIWAYRASPSWVAKRVARGDQTCSALTKAVFQRRLAIFYGATLLFVAGWMAYAVVLKHRAAEMQRVIDITPGR
jgi:hypothetical protein